jgi:hypothetical protein
VTGPDRQAAVAAALILGFVAVGLLLMPRLVIGLSELTSPFAGAALALLFILAPFIVLWLRSRAQRRAAQTTKRDPD